MIFSVNQQKDGEIRGEKISKSNGFFSDQKLDFNISKKISCKHPDIYKSGNCFKCSWWFGNLHRLFYFGTIDPSPKPTKRYSCLSM